MKVRQGTGRRSLVWKLFASVWLCVVLLLLFNWLLNSFALTGYYQNQKRDSLVRAFNSLNELYQISDEQAVEKLQQLSNNENISALICSRSRVIYSDRVDGMSIFPGGVLLHLPNFEPGEYTMEISVDERTDTQFILLQGRMTNGYWAILRTSVQAIEESVDITNRFLMISGIVTLLISTGLVVVIARSFIKPIRTLSRVAGSVAALNFQDRYEGGGSGELDDLGNSINAMAAALEQTVSHLYAANEQLALDNERKTQQNDARRAFIANVSHELKTPIALIQTYAEGLKEDIAADAGNREYYCAVIEDEAQKMSEMIRRMTMLMQLEGGSEQLVTERFDIGELARNLLQKYAPRLAQKAVTVAPPPETPLLVQADDYWIENVLTNYLSNALNHVSEGGRVAITVQLLDNGCVRTAVFNTGDQIPTEELPRIWESFYKVDKARTRAYGGTGIGLSVVASIMKAHGMPFGVRNVSDERGIGVEFFFDLPQG